MLYDMSDKARVSKSLYFTTERSLGLGFGKVSVISAVYLIKQLIDLVLDLLDQGVELGLFVGQDGAGDDGPGDSAGTAEGDLGRDEDVRHVLCVVGT